MDLDDIVAEIYAKAQEILRDKLQSESNDEDANKDFLAAIGSWVDNSTVI